MYQLLVSMNVPYQLTSPTDEKDEVIIKAFLLKKMVLKRFITNLRGVAISLGEHNIQEAFSSIRNSFITSSNFYSDISNHCKRF